MGIAIYARSLFFERFWFADSTLTRDNTVIGAEHGADFKEGEIFPPDTCGVLPKLFAS